MREDKSSQSLQTLQQIGLGIAIGIVTIAWIYKKFIAQQQKDSSDSATMQEEEEKKEEEVKVEEMEENKEPVLAPQQ